MSANRLRPLSALVLFVLALSRTTGSLAQDPTAPGAHAVGTAVYDNGNQVFLPGDFNPVPTMGVQRVEERAVVFYPLDLTNGPYPIVFILHGNHATVIGMAGGAPAPLGTWPPGATETAIDSYRGYDYIGRVLASQGFIVVSISANGVNAFGNAVPDGGIRARAELIRHHIDLWDGWSTAGGGPLPAPDEDAFVGAVDMTRIGLIGHSRGGEAVVLCPNAFVVPPAPGSPPGTPNRATYAAENRIRAVLAIAPTDFSGHRLNRIPLGVLLPYCDGDVSDLSGCRIYDRVRYNVPGDPAPKHTFLALGANHNYYNTIWSEGSGLRGSVDDWSFTYFFRDASPGKPAVPYTVLLLPRNADHHAGRLGVTTANIVIDGNTFQRVTNPGAVRPSRLTEADEQANGLVISTGFIRTYLPPDNTFVPLMKGDAPLPAAARPAQTFVSYQPPFTAAGRRDVNSQDPNVPAAANKLAVNDLGAVVAQKLLDPFDLRGNGVAMIPGQRAERQPNAFETSVLRASWTSVNAVYYTELPAAPAGTRDVSRYAAFQFRASTNFNSDRNWAVPAPAPPTEPTGVEQNFIVTFMDETGRAASVTVNTSARQRALYFPPGDIFAGGAMPPWEVPRSVMNTVRIPLTAFTGVNLARIQRIYFRFTNPTRGFLFFSDVVFAD